MSQGAGIKKFDYYTVKLPLLKSIADLYLSIRIDDKRTEYKISTYFLFKKDILDDIKILKRELRNTIIGVVDRGESPAFINSRTRTNTLIKVSIDKDIVDIPLTKPLTKYTGENSISILKASLTQIISNSETYYNYVNSIIDRYDKQKTTEEQRKKLIEEQRRKAQEEKQKIEAERQKMIEKRKKHYQEISEDIDDFLTEIYDLCESQSEIKKYSEISLNYRFPIDVNKKFTELTDSALRGLLQANRRISSKYPNLTVTINLKSHIEIVIIDEEFNKKSNPKYDARIITGMFEPPTWDEDDDYDEYDEFWNEEDEDYDGFGA